MNYIKVKWIHTFPDEPIWLYSELNSERWETRKVEVYADGRIGYAGAGVAICETGLGKEPLPALSEIAADPQFEPEDINRNEFEEIWSMALGKA